MPSNIYGRFAEQNSVVLSGQVASSNNNQISLNAAIAENNHLRSTIAALQPLGLTITPGENVPNVSGVVQNTIGAALAGIGQEGTPSQDPGGGGIPCFSFDTPIWMATDVIKPIGRIITGHDYVMCFDGEGQLHKALVTAKFEHYYAKSYVVKFADGRSTVTTQEHRYWTGDGFQPISELDGVMHYEQDWNYVGIIDKQIVTVPIVLYNLTVEKYQTYFANNDGVHNIKKDNDPGGGI